MNRKIRKIGYNILHTNNTQIHAYTHIYIVFIYVVYLYILHIIYRAAS